MDVKLDWRGRRSRRGGLRGSPIIGKGSIISGSGGGGVMNIREIIFEGLTRRVFITVNMIRYPAGRRYVHFTSALLIDYPVGGRDIDSVGSVAGIAYPAVVHKNQFTIIVMTLLHQPNQSFQHQRQRYL